MNACIFANGDMDPVVYSDMFCNGACRDLIIAADGGARHCLALGVTPHLIVGDMDSIDNATASATPGIERVLFKKEKDKTDAECAVDEAFARKCSQVTLFGGTGKWTDHTLGNISLAAKFPGRVALADESGLLLALESDQECFFEGLTGAIVSVTAWGKDANIVSSGLKYDSTNKALQAGTRGISNEIARSPASLHVLGGMVLVFVERSVSISVGDSNRQISSYSMFGRASQETVA